MVIWNVLEEYRWQLDISQKYSMCDWNLGGNDVISQNIFYSKFCGCSKGDHYF